MDVGEQQEQMLDGFAPAALYMSLEPHGPILADEGSNCRAMLGDYAGIAGADGNDPLNRYGAVGPWSNIAAYNGILYANSATATPTSATGPRTR